MSKWHLINADLRAVGASNAAPKHKRVGYAAASASQIRTDENTSPEEKKNVASPCFIFRRRECLDTWVARHTSLDFEGGNKSVSALFTHN